MSWSANALLQQQGPLQRVTAPCFKKQVHRWLRPSLGPSVGEQFLQCERSLQQVHKWLRPSLGPSLGPSLRRADRQNRRQQGRTGGSKAEQEAARQHLLPTSGLTARSLVWKMSWSTGSAGTSVFFDSRILGTVPGRLLLCDGPESWGPPRRTVTSAEFGAAAAAAAAAACDAAACADAAVLATGAGAPGAPRPVEALAMEAVPVA